MEGLAMTPSFWEGRRVLVTGHTGFKGAWLALWLHQAGARVTGFALPAATTPSACELFRLHQLVDSQLGDVRDARAIKAAVHRAQPEVVFHLASQAIVREGLRDPVATFATNVLGLVNVFEALRASSGPAVLINVTSDKVYQNNSDGGIYAETDPLGGNDPYSASKACAEIVTSAYRSTVLRESLLRVSSARAGNVIGGGDWAADRIVPDIVRAVCAGERVVLRYPAAMRPWQHVIEPLCGYLDLAEAMVTQGRHIDGAYNFGPSEISPPVSVAELAARFLSAFKSPEGWCEAEAPQPPEMHRLHIDSSKARTTLGWNARLSIAEAIEWTAAWYQAWRSGNDMRAFSLEQVEAYELKGALV